MPFIWCIRIICRRIKLLTKKSPLYSPIGDSGERKVINNKKIAFNIPYIGKWSEKDHLKNRPLKYLIEESS